MIQTEQFYISSQLLIGLQKHRERVAFYQVAADHREVISCHTHTPVSLYSHLECYLSSSSSPPPLYFNPSL